MEYVSLALGLLSVLIAAFSDEVKVAKAFVSDKSAGLTEKYKCWRAAFIAKYESDPVFRSHSNLLALRA